MAVATQDKGLFASVAALVVRSVEHDGVVAPVYVSAVVYEDSGPRSLVASAVKDGVSLVGALPDLTLTDEDLAAAVGLGDLVSRVGQALPERCTVLHCGPVGAAWDVLAGHAWLDVLDLAHVLLPDYQVDGLADLAMALDLDRGACNGDLLLDCFAELVGRAMALPLPVLDAIYRVLPASIGHGLSLTTFFETAVTQVRAQWEAATGEAYQSPARHGDALQAILSNDPLPRPRMDIPDPGQYEPVSPDTVAGFLSEGGAIGKHLGNYEFRDEQVSMARAVCEAFNDGSHLMAEAGTGVGKSLAYLVPSILWAVKNRTPVVISTNTKNLQTQLFEKDIPLLQESMGIGFSAALIRGRTNYLCLRKFFHLVDHAGSELGLDDEAAPRRTTLAALLTWLGGTRTGDVTDLAEWDRLARDGWGGRVTAASEECAGRACRYWRHCLLRRARARSLGADVVVANHSLVFAEMGMRSPAIPPHAQVIFDEAHNLEESATRHFSTELSQLRLRFLIRRLGATGRGRKAEKGRGLLGVLMQQTQNGAITANMELQSRVARACDGASTLVPLVDAAAGPFFTALAAVLRGAGNRIESVRLDKRESMPKGWDDVLEEHKAFALQLDRLIVSVDSIQQALGELGDEALGHHQEYATDLTAVRQSLAEYLSDISFVLAASDAGFVYWVERAGRWGARAWAAPISISRRLCESLYMQKQSCIFASATLSVRGKFGFLSKRLGLDLIEADRIRTLAVGSPFDYENQCLLVVPMFLPEPGSGDYATALGGFLARLFKHTDGRALSLFTSYETMRATRSVLQAAMPPGSGRVLMQGEDGSRSVITDTFRREPRSVLMGTHSFWEGVDVVGDSLSCLVVTRLPFAVFTEPLYAARCEKIEEDGGSAFRHYSLPQAVIRFRQGFGRLIRHRDDRGIVVVTDRRLFTKNYGSWFRSSVPALTLRCYEEEQLIDRVTEFLA
jgi:Rad3-related DNA helicase